MKKTVRITCLISIVSICLSTLVKAAPATAFNIKDFGAKGDSIFINTTAINNAITTAKAN